MQTPPTNDPEWQQVRAEWIARIAAYARTGALSPEQIEFNIGELIDAAITEAWLTELERISPWDKSRLNVGARIETIGLKLQELIGQVVTLMHERDRAHDAGYREAVRDYERTQRAPRR